MAKKILSQAEALGLYNPKTGEADGEALLGFLDGYVGSGSSFEFTLPLIGKLKVPNEDLKVWVENLRKLHSKGDGNGRRIPAKPKES